MTGNEIKIGPKVQKFNCLYLGPLHILIFFINLQGIGLGTKSWGPESQDKKPSRHHIPHHPQAKLNLE